MKVFLLLVAGYFIGCINPAYIISKIRCVDIRKTGTGNLGTTNAFINFGKGFGSIVLLVDMLKAFLPVWICLNLINIGHWGAATIGCGVLLGHMFPFYTGFKGGKGIASLGGFILAVSWKWFLLLLFIGCVLALLFNYGCCISFSASVLFPVIYGISERSFPLFILVMLTSICILVKHSENIRKIKAGEEMPIRNFLVKHVIGGRNV